MLSKIIPAVAVIILIFNFQDSDAQTILMEGEGYHSLGVGITGSKYYASDIPSFSSIGIGVSVKRYADLRFIYSNYRPQHSSGDTFTNKAFQLAFYPAKDWENDILTVETAFTIGSTSMDGVPDLSGDIYGFDFSISKNLASEKGVVSPFAGFGFALVSNEIRKNADTSITIGATLGRHVYLTPFYTRILSDGLTSFGISISVVPF